MNQNRRVSVVFSALLFTVSFQTSNEAKAAASSSARIENFRIVLTDLDLNDGVTPGLIFNQINPAFVALRFQDEFNRVTLDVVDIDTGQAFPTRDLSVTFATGLSFAQASSTGSAYGVSGATVSAHAIAYGSPTQATTFASGGMALGTEIFFLTPNTRVDLSGTAFVEASRGEPGLGFRESASGVVYLGIQGEGAPDIAEFTTAAVNSEFSPQITAINQRSFAMGYSNITNAISAVQVQLGVEAATSSTVPFAPIPEMHTQAMMLIGLALVGAIFRRGAIGGEV